MGKFSASLIAFLILVVVAAACRAEEAVVAPMPTPTSVATPTPTPMPTPAPTPTPTPTPEPLTVAQIFDLLADSIAFIETEAGFTGSAILLADGYLLTNAHVIWPYDDARVVFRDGTEFLDVPIMGRDMMADLALLGPVQTSSAGVFLKNGESLSIGSEVLLIGYPEATGRFPQPTITRGILSSLREWDQAGITYFQTDALIGPGQSGGMLVDMDGRAIGLSGFVSAAGFSVVASLADLVPRVEALLAGETLDEAGERVLTRGALDTVHTGNLLNLWDVSAYMLEAVAGTAVELEVVSENDIALLVAEVDGFVSIFEDQTFTGSEMGLTTIGSTGRHFVLVGQNDIGEADFTLTSNLPLRSFADPDDGSELSIGETIAGNIDHYLDFDVFLLTLLAGQRVKIHVSSPNIDPELFLDAPFFPEEEVLYDDDSGGGIFGTDSEMVFEADTTATYWVIVDDFEGLRFGGYFLTVEETNEATTVETPS
ncbi:MAG: serine protease [Dehalococcoidia bacterium]